MTRIATILLLLLFIPGYAHTADKSLSDSQIRKAMIQQSITAYPGNCPCPYNRARNGSRCGKRSAWSRPGGHSPLCYDSDISDQMVKQYRTKKYR